MYTYTSPLLPHPVPRFISPLLLPLPPLPSPSLLRSRAPVFPSASLFLLSIVITEDGVSRSRYPASLPPPPSSRVINFYNWHSFLPLPTLRSLFKKYA